MKIFGLDTSSIFPSAASLTEFADPGHTHRDWRIIALSGLVALLLLAGICVWIFLEVEAGSFATVSGSSGEEQALTLDREELNQTVSDFQKRRATFDLLRDRQPDIPNPAR